MASAAGGGRVRPGGPKRLLGQLALFLGTIRIAHTVFALPFALMSLVLVADGWPSVHDLVWVTTAMAGARTFAMGLNRIIDARVDALNRRTAERALASGELDLRAAWALSLLAVGIFLYATYQLEPLAQKLWPPVLLAMVAYPYGKRFTWLAHLGLGVVYVMVPPAVWVAVTGGITAGSIYLGVAAATWVVGFDLIYACQDVDSDREHGLYSFPARFGIAAGLRVAQLAHVGTLGFLVATGVALDVGAIYYVGVAVSAAVLLYELRLVKPGDLSRLNAAFFNANGIMSVAFFGFVAVDVAYG